MLARTLLATLTASALAALELTPDNFDKEVLSSGKAALVKVRGSQHLPSPKAAF